MVRLGGRGQAPIHFKEETISLCHPESASFDAHIVFFEMSWGQAPPLQAVNR